MTQLNDVESAVEFGIDAIGVILHAPKSARQISLLQAEKLFKAVPPFVARVGVFVDADSDTILDAADRLFLDYAQLHGTPDAELIHDICAVKLFLSVPVNDDVVEAVERCSAFFDRGQMSVSLDSGKIGGTGKENDWDAVAKLDLSKWSPVMFAGGLTPENVGGVIRRFRPSAVDVSTGIERDTKGFKDVERMRAFVAAVREADRANVEA